MKETRGRTDYKKLKKCYLAKGTRTTSQHLHRLSSGPATSVYSRQINQRLSLRKRMCLEKAKASSVDTVAPNTVFLILSLKEIQRL